MSEKWTTEQVRSRLRETQEKILNFDYPIARQEWADIELERYMDISEALCDTIESQRLELEAAQRVLAASNEVVDTWLSIRRETREFEDWMTNLCEAVNDYDDVSEHNTPTGKDTKMKNWNDFFSRDELTIRDVDLAMIEVFNRRDPDESKAFVDAYRKITPSAVENLGYLAGYRDPDTMCAMWEFFNVYHPVFGRRRVSYEEAFELGRRWMQDSTK